MADISLKWLLEPFSSILLSEKEEKSTFKINYGEVNSFILGNYRYTDPSFLPVVESRTGVYASFLESYPFYSVYSNRVEAGEYIFSPYSSLTSGTLKNFDSYTKGEVVLRETEEPNKSVYLKIPKIPLGYSYDFSSSKQSKWYDSMAVFINDYKIDQENTLSFVPTSSGIIEKNNPWASSSFPFGGFFGDESRRISKEGEFGPHFHINIFNYNKGILEQNLRSNIVFPFRANRIGDLSSRNASIIVTVVAQPKLSKTWKYNTPVSFNFELLGWQIMDLNLSSPNGKLIKAFAERQTKIFFDNEIQSVSYFRQELIFPNTYIVVEKTDDDDKKYQEIYDTSYLTYAQPGNPGGNTYILNPHYLDYKGFTFSHEGDKKEGKGAPQEGEKYLTELETQVVRIILYHKKHAGGKIHIHKIFEAKSKFKYIYNSRPEFQTREGQFRARFRPVTEDEVKKGVAKVKIFTKEDAFQVGYSAAAVHSDNNLEFFLEEEEGGEDGGGDGGGGEGEGGPGGVGGGQERDGNGRGLQPSNAIQRGGLQGSSPLQGGGLEPAAGVKIGRLQGSRGLEGAKGLGKTNGGESLSGEESQSGGGANLYNLDTWAVFYGFEDEGEEEEEEGEEAGGEG